MNGTIAEGRVLVKEIRMKTITKYGAAIVSNNQWLLTLSADKHDCIPANLSIKF